MKNNKFEDLISKKPTLLMIKCKNLEKGLNLNAVYSQNAPTRHLSIEDKMKLLDIMKSDSSLFLEEIIDWHLQEEKVLSFMKGDSILLPIGYQQFYDECIAVETGNYKLYINDKAIEKCSDIVFKLSERSRRDCFNFVKGKLEKKQAEHLYILLDSHDYKIGRCASFEDENDFNFSMQDNTACYSIYKKKDGAYDEKDIYTIFALIDEFQKSRGVFKRAKSNKTDLVMYNQGSMKIEGINNDKRMYEKVKTLMKREK